MMKSPPFDKQFSFSDFDGLPLGGNDTARPVLLALDWRTVDKNFANDRFRRVIGMSFCQDQVPYEKSGIHGLPCHAKSFGMVAKLPGFVDSREI